MLKKKRTQFNSNANKEIIIILIIFDSLLHFRTPLQLIAFSLSDITGNLKG
jgi:hypothetical protein